MTNLGKIIFNLIFIGIIATSVSAQTITPSVIAAGGGSKSSNGNHLSFTIGQIAIPSFRNDKILTQGFQQANPKLVNTEKSTNSENTGIIPKVFPNPTHDKVSVTIFQSIENENYKLQIFDISGQLIDAPKESYTVGTNSKIDIDLSYLTAGNYFIRLTPASRPNNPINLTIIKN